MDQETRSMFELIVTKLDGIDKRLDSMEQRLDGMDKRLSGIERRQDEMYRMQCSLEENIKVTRAEQEKMSYTLIDIQGKVAKLTEKVNRHETVINQIRAIQ